MTATNPSLILIFIYLTAAGQHTSNYITAHYSTQPAAPCFSPCSHSLPPSPSSPLPLPRSACSLPPDGATRLYMCLPRRPCISSVDRCRPPGRKSPMKSWSCRYVLPKIPLMIVERHQPFLYFRRECQSPSARIRRSDTVARRQEYRHRRRSLVGLCGRLDRACVFYRLCVVVGRQYRQARP